MAESGNELTDFQKKKILRVFHILYDVNQDGVISAKDFSAAIDKVCRLLDWKDERRNSAEKTLMGIWEQLKQLADSNEDNKVSREEWLKMWSERVSAITTGEGFPQWQQDFMQFLFNVNDKSGDGRIDLDEYTTFNAAYGIPEEECKSAFQKISGGNKYINYDEFKTLWIEFFTSNSPDAKGNHLFGDPAKYPAEN